MLRYFAVRPRLALEEQERSELLHELQGAVAAQEKKKRKATPWAQWSREKKEGLAKELIRGNWQLLQVVFFCLGAFMLDTPPHS